MNAVYTQALAAIAERRGLLAGETPDVWLLATPQADYDDSLMEIIADGWRTIATNVAQPISDLIVAAVNAFERDTDALEAVLLRHEPEPAPIGVCWVCHCRVTDEDRYVLDWHLCPDAQAALNALGVGQ